MANFTCQGSGTDPTNPDCTRSIIRSEPSCFFSNGPHGYNFPPSKPLFRQLSEKVSQKQNKASFQKWSRHSQIQSSHHQISKWARVLEIPEQINGLHLYPLTLKNPGRTFLVFDVLKVWFSKFCLSEFLVLTSQQASSMLGGEDSPVSASELALSMDASVSVLFGQEFLCCVILLILATLAPNGKSGTRSLNSYHYSLGRKGGIM